MQNEFDLIIRGASVVDGTRNAARRADVGIRHDKIAEVGIIPNEALTQETLNAEGLTVCPGFIDIHTHADIALLARPAHLPKVMQGVTTEVFSNCGLGFAPITDAALEIQRSYISGLFGDDGNSETDDPRSHRVDWSWRSVAEFLACYESSGIGTNVAYLIPHGAVRVSVMGMQERAADRGEVERMRSMVLQGMDEGAWGVSTGIWYAPMRAADRTELVTVFRAGGLFATHQRDYGISIFEATQESIEVAREANVPVQISHLQMNGPQNAGRAGKLIEMLNAARSSGVDVTCDTYPYTAGSTFIQSLLPAWASEGGPTSILDFLAIEGESKSRVLAYLNTLSAVWSEYMLVGATSSINQPFDGLTFPEIASARDLTVPEWICRVLLEDELRACFVHHGAHEGNVREIMSWDHQMVGSDGLHLTGKTHPRLFGTFPRVLGKYVRETQTISLESAVYKMTGAPAERLGLKDRGFIRPGLAADLTIIDSATVTDTATFTDPLQYPAGVPFVFVNGVAAVRNGLPTGALAGSVLRRQ